MLNSMNLRYNFNFSKYIFLNNTLKSNNFSRDYHKNVNIMQCAQNPYMEKYASKIAEVRKMSPEGFKQSLRENLKDIETSSLGSKNLNKEKFQKKDSKVSHFQREKDLNQIMKLDSVQNKTAEELETIWKEYHREKDGVYAVLPGNSFENMHKNMKEFPVFLFVLPRAEGYEFVMGQIFDQSCYFTSLINYQAFKENAPICLTVTYFTEFQNEKGIVLMRGEYDNSLKAHETQCLTNQLQLYYGGQDEEKFNLLWKFNKQPESFKHMDIITNFESSLGQ